MSAVIAFRVDESRQRECLSWITFAMRRKYVVSIWTYALFWNWLCAFCEEVKLLRTST